VINARTTVHVLLPHFIGSLSQQFIVIVTQSERTLLDQANKHAPDLINQSTFYRGKPMAIDLKFISQISSNSDYFHLKMYLCNFFFISGSQFLKVVKTPEN
jgi:hypothetical protein